MIASGAATADAHKLKYARAAAKAETVAKGAGARGAPYYSFGSCERRSAHKFVCDATRFYYGIVNGSGCYYHGHGWFGQSYFIKVRLGRVIYASALPTTYGEPDVVRCAPTTNPGTPWG